MHAQIVEGPDVCNLLSNGHTHRDTEREKRGRNNKCYSLNLHSGVFTISFSISLKQIFHNKVEKVFLY